MKKIGKFFVLLMLMLIFLSGCNGKEVDKYKVTWTNHDGTVLEVDLDVPADTMPEYDGVTPTKPGFIFSGWSPTVSKVTGDVTYVAQFTATTKKYKVTWKNHDGTVLEEDLDVPHGTEPEYNGDVPTKEGLIFSGWSPAISAVTEDIVYTAQFSETANKYKVTWKNYDGTVLKEDLEVEQGTRPEYTGDIPTKPGGYTFSGWTPNVSIVVGDVEYTAVFIKNEVKLDDYIFVEKDDGYAIMRYLGNDTNVTIPSEYKGKPVTSIEQWAFFDNKTMVSVVIPDSIIYIREDAFAYSIALKNIHFGKNVKSVELHAFDGCESLETVNFPEGLTYIGEMIFIDCTALKSVSIPNSIEYFGEEVFFKVKGIEYTEFQNGNYLGNAENPHLVFIGMFDDTQTTITIHDNCKVIANGAFVYKDITTINFGSGVQIIGAAAFGGCENLTEITIPDNVVKIGNSAFYGVPVTKVTLGNGVKYIGDNAFSNCKQLVTINIPDDVEFIGDGVFYYCISLNKTEYENCYYLGNETNPHLLLLEAINKYASSITIHENTKFIGNAALASCKSLTSITIPKNVKSFARNVFYGCNNLTEIIVDENNPVYSAPNKTAIIEKETNKLIIGLSNTVIPEGVVSIGEFAFNNCDGLLEIVIPEGVVSIDDYAFSYCMYLKSVTLPSTLIKIGRNAFGDCYQLETLTLPNNLKYIDDLGFHRCRGITSITIPDSVTYIGQEAFGNCSSATSLSIGKGIVVISGLAFYGCEALTSITVPDSVVMIDDSAFYGCSAATSITIGSGVMIIGSVAFGECENVSAVTVDGENEVYDSRDNCNAIIEKETNTLIAGFKASEIPNSVTAIGNFAFYYATGLENLKLHDDITSIGRYAFYYSGLQSITLGKGLVSIGDAAFYRCSNLDMIIIPESVTTIGRNAFRNCNNIKIYAEATEKGADWDDDWNSSNRPVFWYSEEANYDGIHWHYVDEIPVVWAEVE